MKVLFLAVGGESREDIVRNLRGMASMFEGCSVINSGAVGHTFHNELDDAIDYDYEIIETLSDKPYLADFV